MWGVSGVQFLLNGTPLGAEDLTAPYAVLWDTASAPIGANTLSARARDAAGNTALAADVTVYVSRYPAAAAEWSRRCILIRGRVRQQRG